MTAPVVDAESLSRREDDFSDGRNSVEDALDSTEGTLLVNGCGSVSPSSLSAEAREPPSRASGEPISGASAGPLSQAVTTESRDSSSGASTTQHPTVTNPSSDPSSSVLTAATQSADPTPSVTAAAAAATQSAVPSSSDSADETQSAVPSSSDSFIPIDQITQRLGIHSQFCFFCRGFYGPSFGQPICGPCHAFLYPERAGEAECPRESNGSRQEEKDDSGDSGNEEPTEFYGGAASSSAADRTRRVGGVGGGGGGEEVYSVSNPVEYRDIDGGVDNEDDVDSLSMRRNSAQFPSTLSPAASLSLRPNPLSLEIDASRVQAVDLDSPSSSSSSSSSSVAEDIRLNNAAATNADERPEVAADVCDVDCASGVSGAGSTNDSVSKPARFPGGRQSNNNGTPLHNVRSEKLAEKILQMTTTKDKEVVPARLVDSLPPEVLIAIFSFLDDLSLWTAMQVSRRWRNLVADEYPDDAWRTWLRMRWPLFEPLLHPKSWREAYSRLVQSSPCLLCLEQMTIRNSPPIEENSWRHRRLRSELKALQSDPPEGIQAIPMDRFYCHWQATITGPQGSPYEGGVFFLSMQIPPSYPMKPPVVRFLTKTFHPNISRHGDIGLDSIHHNWSLALTISKVLISIQSLLTDPFIETSMEPQISSLIRGDSEQYNRIARIWTWRFAMHDVMSVSAEDLFDGP